MRPVSAAAMTASRMTPVDGAADEDGLVAEGRDARVPAGAVRCDARAAGPRMPLTTSSVEALPDLRMVTSTPRWPSWRTMLVCGMQPSLTVATSRR